MGLPGARRIVDARRGAHADGLLRGVLAGEGCSGTEVARLRGGLIVPAEPSVSVVINLFASGTETSAGFVTAAGLRYAGSAPVASPTIDAGPRAWVTLTLTPPGAYRVLGLPLAELDRPATGLSDVLGPAALELAARLREAAGWVERFDLLREFAVGRAEHGGSPAPEVTRAWARLTETGGRIPVRRLADEVGWSHQHLIRMFHRQLGHPPKTLARLLRLRGTLRDIRADGRVDQAVFAAGYHDRAHFARDLREFVGTTPGRYVRGALPCGCVTEADAVGDPAADPAAHGEVNSLQDANHDHR
ncbi:helix-turn-helix domain-containing protein [Embleya sp. AB8]|uniref:AraC family transcriptional regulator n=1 Tax=Embleya sp. AB8 TaxID=3156304 RepID=UPI003C76038F